MSERQFKRIRCTINGRPVDKMVDVRASLTDLLRDDFSLTSVKKGCEVGECGACNVLINGETFNSCIYLAVWADGKEIVTLEGLAGPNGEISDIQQAFVDEAAIQCGFCTPGIIMTTTALLNKNPNPSEEEVRDALSGNYCRCISQYHVFEAIASVAGRGVELDEKWEGRR